jgi:hypothetical protein
MDEWTFCSSEWWLARSSDDDGLSPEMERVRTDLGYQLRHAKGFVKFEPWWEQAPNRQVLYELMKDSTYFRGDVLTTVDMTIDDDLDRRLALDPASWRGSPEQRHRDMYRVDWLNSVYRGVVETMKDLEGQKDREEGEAVPTKQAEQRQRPHRFETPIRKPSPFRR